jgi:hypothetical protein
MEFTERIKRRAIFAGGKVLPVAAFSICIGYAVFDLPLRPYGRANRFRLVGFSRASGADFF